MKADWTQQFRELVLRHKGDQSEVDYARHLGLARSTYQRIVGSRQSIKYEYVQLVLRRLGLCHCEVANLPCPHRERADQL